MPQPTTYRFKVPRPEGDLWKICATPLLREDDLKFGVWKDEVHHLLIFAGLFSSVVTAFVVQISDNLQTAPTPSCIRVNTCWFLSLILSLLTVLFGIIALQWLREFEYYGQVLPSKDVLARRAMHHESFETWFVPHIFTSLPLFLNVALLLFFAGLVDFLWQLNTRVAVPSGIIISFAFLFLIITTTMPTIQSFWLINSSNRVSPPSQCPYKSPQSWAFLRLTTSGPARTILTFVGSISLQFAIINCSIFALPLRWINSEHMLYNLLDRLRISFHLRYLATLKNWKVYDDFWLHERQRAGAQKSSNHFFAVNQQDVDFDAARGLAYIIQTQPQSDDLALALYHCFQELPSSAINDSTFNVMLQSLPSHIRSKKTTRITSVAVNPPDGAVRNENELFLISRLPKATSNSPSRVIPLRQVELFIRHITYLIAERPKMARKNRRVTPRLLVPPCLRSGPVVSKLPIDLRKDVCIQVLELFTTLIFNAAMTNSEDWFQELCSTEEVMGDFFQVVHSVTLGCLVDLQPADSTQPNPLSIIRDALEFISLKLDEHTSNCLPEPLSWSPYARQLQIPLQHPLHRHPNHPLYHIGRIYASRAPNELWSAQGDLVILDSVLKSVVSSLRRYEVKTKRSHYFQQYHSHYSQRWYELLQRLDLRDVQFPTQDNVQEESSFVLPLTPLPQAYFGGLRTRACALPGAMAGSELEEMHGDVNANSGQT